MNAGSKMEVLTRQEISRRLSRQLDSLGYSQEMISLRKDYYDKFDSLRNLTAKGHNLVTVGSRGEGTIRFHESDWDILTQPTSCVCVDTQQTSTKTVLLMVDCIYHPGHFKLVLQQQGQAGLAFSDHYKSSPLGSVLSSESFLRGSEKIAYDNISGPAFYKSRHGPKQIGLDYDIVVSIQCICSSILTRWLNRPRKHNWPTAELMHTISKMSGNMVATGVGGCDDEDIEWRLCFNKIELLIVRSWNNTQSKLYKILKMIKSDILKPTKKEITSFILKNIVLWLSEEFPQSEFRSDNLFDWVVKALRLLKRAVKLHYLPYYMFPERNLLAERIQKCERKRIIGQIRDIIQCGPHLLIACKKINFSMKMSPADLLIFERKTTLIEQDYMAFHIQRTLNKIRRDEISFDNMMLLPMLLNSPWPLPVQQELDKCSNQDEKLRFLLS